MRLEAFGFEEVYEYAAGKLDWLARGLPREGEQAGLTTAGDLARDDAATCGLEDDAQSVHERIAASPYGFCLVLGPGQVVLGRVRRSALEEAGAGTAADLMEPGPSTVRAHLPAAELAESLRERGLKSALVTDPEGRLLGVFRAADAVG